MAEQRFLPRFLLLLSGLIVWAGHFLLVYMATGLLCERPGWIAEIGGFHIVQVGIGIGTVLAIALLLALFWFAWRSDVRARRPGDTAQFMTAVTLGTIALAGLAVLWEGLPAVTIPPCV